MSAAAPQAAAATKAPPDRRAREERGGGHFNYLPALDGVRAFAVLAVMAYHGGVGGFPGGFLGVDSFFVLSGFLITTLLTREWAETGGIRLGSFWARRARRLLPALLLVMLFVAAYAYFFAPPGTGPGIRTDSFFTLAYSANWHFIASGANYFSASGPVSPLTHTWSLAVEEQFYLVWPLVVVGVMLLAGRRTVRGLRILLLFSVAGTLASALEMALLWDGTNQTRLYYGTDTHAQCILVGASLAILLSLAAHARRSRGPLPRLRRRRGGDPAWAATTAWSKSALTVTGVVGVAATALLWTQVDGQQWWLYHGGFLLAALATAGVLLSGVCAQGAIVARLLALRPLRYTGRISYGLYLWHFPLFVWLDHARTGLSGWSLFGFRVVVTFLVASASYRLVERPIRERSFLSGWRTLVLAPASIAAVGAALVVATPSIASSNMIASSPPPPASPTQAPATATSANGASGNGASGSPGTAPSVPVLLVGDSMAETLGNGVGGPVGQYFGLDVINAGVPNCSLAIGTFEVQNFPPNPGAPSCDPGSGAPLWPAQWADLVAQHNPAVSVVLARLDIVDRLYDGTWTHIGEPDYDGYLLDQIRLAVKTLTANGGKVVLLSSPYYDTGEQPNGTPWPEDDPTRVDLYNSMLRTVAQEDPGNVFVVDLNKIADPSGQYQADVDGVQIRYTDGIHWTFQGDCWLAARLLPQIAAVARDGSLPPPASVNTLVRQAEDNFPDSLCPAPN